MARRRRGGSREAALYADAQWLLAEVDDPARVTQLILMALRGGRPGKQPCYICGQQTVPYGQRWVPRALTRAVPALTATP